MLVLIVHDAPARQAELAVAFLQAGFQTASTGDRAFAECFIKNGLVDLLVMTERVGGRLTHALSLLAEYQNPMVETILMTGRKDRDTDELFSLLPSLHCMVAPDTPPALITKLAISALAGPTDQMPACDAQVDEPQAQSGESQRPSGPQMSNSGVFEIEEGELLQTA